MEAARIDWNNIDSVFVEDRLYEHFNAPKWVNLSSPDHPSPLSVDDVAWFCTPDCNHPTTADDFLRSTPSPFSPKTRHRRSSSHYQLLPLDDRNQGDLTFKRKGTRGSPSGCYEDVETKSPDGSKTVAVDPSAEKKKLADDDSLRADAVPRLKTTLSASNLFAGRDLLKQISEFCSELKKLATRTKEKEFAGTRIKANGIPPFAKAKSSDIISSTEGVVGVEVKERSPLLEVSEKASDALKRSKVKEKKRTNRRMEDAENVPISIELDKVGHKGHFSQIRTSPPTPQCFSATREPPSESTPLPASKTRLKERHILGEVKQTRRDATTEENNLNKGGGVGVVHAKTPDVFWFLKPCTLSS